MQTDLNLLYTKRDMLHERLTNSNRRFVHPKSVDNLLFHIGEIDNAEERDWAFTQLDVYLEACESNLPNINRTFGLQAYSEMLYPLFVYYHSNLQFEKFDIALFIFYYLIGFGVAFFVFGIKGIIAVSVILIIRAVYFYRKSKERKVFSLFY